MLCRKYGFSASDICSHKEAAERGYGWQHFDPENWLQVYGKDMDWFRGRVAEKLGEKELHVGDVIKLQSGTKTVNGVELAGWVTDGRPVYVMAINGDQVTITVDASLAQATGTVYKSAIIPCTEKEEVEITCSKAEYERMEKMLADYSRENAALREQNGILEIKLEKAREAWQFLQTL